MTIYKVIYKFKADKDVNTKYFTNQVVAAEYCNNLVMDGKPDDPHVVWPMLRSVEVIETLPLQTQALESDKP